MHFNFAITSVELIVSSKAICWRKTSPEAYGKARWRNLKGNAYVQFADGMIRHAKIHWSEAHGIGPKDYEIKRILD